MGEGKLATELLGEVKKSARIWFVAFFVMVVLEVVTILGFVWYLQVPSEDITLSNDEGNVNYVGDDLNGEVNNGQD